MDDLALGIDSSTTAVKCVAFNRGGGAVAEGRAGIPLQNPAPGRYEQSPRDWRDSMIRALAALGGEIDLARVKGVAISNQRETVAFLDAAGVAVRPAIVWLDERCAPFVDSFAARVGEREIHRITGKHKDITPVVYRLAWMRECEPENFRATAIFSDVHAYLAFCLGGELRTSWASADPSGCWDIEKKRWAPEVIGALDLDERRFPAAHPPCAPLGRVSEEAARQTGLAAGTPIFAGGGDGQCAGLGAAAVRPEDAYLNLGTAVVSGRFCSDYRWGDAWRTMSAMNGGYIMETCLRAGTFLLNWLVRDIFGETGGDAHQTLEQKARALIPGAGGVLLLPYWSGVMTPHWDPRARGAIIGLSDGAGREHLYRATLEGIAMEQALATRMLEEQGGGAIESFYAVGGGAQSDLWCQIIADAAQRRVCRLDTVEASALGAGMAAAVGLGWRASPVKAAQAMRGKVAAIFEPDEKNAAIYLRLLDEYAGAYPATRDLARRFAAAASG
jgi:xylulokinase